MKTKLKTKLALIVMSASTTLSPLVAFADDKTKALPDGGGLKDWILKIVGTLLIAYLAVGLFKDFVQQKWGGNDRAAHRGDPSRLGMLFA